MASSTATMGSPRNVAGRTVQYLGRPGDVVKILNHAHSIRARLDNYIGTGNTLPRHLKKIHIVTGDIVDRIQMACARANAAKASSSEWTGILGLITTPLEEMDNEVKEIVPENRPSILQKLKLGRDHTKLKRVRHQLQNHYEKLMSCPIDFRPQLTGIEMWEAGTQWSGTGPGEEHRYNVRYALINQEFRNHLDAATFLARGGFGTVYRVFYRGVLLARKQIYINVDVSWERRRQLLDEAAIGRKLDNHHHIIKLVGTYWGPQGDDINILTYPLATCDLGRFLEDWEKWDYTNARAKDDDRAAEESKNIVGRLEALGFKATDGDRRPKVEKRLREMMGCITHALKWMHSEDIHHRDLKPENILLKNGQLYITDFGISRDRSLVDNTTTQFNPGLSAAWSAPEVRALAQAEGSEANPRQADIYSLGCVLLYILTVIHAPTRTTPLTPGRHSERRDRFCEYLSTSTNPATTPRAPPHPYIPPEFVEFLEPLLRDDRNTRPSIEEIDNDLQALGGPEGIYHGPCCPYKAPLQRWLSSSSDLAGTTDSSS